jgi:hypothetical protein
VLKSNLQGSGQAATEKAPRFAGKGDVLVVFRIEILKEMSMKSLGEVIQTDGARQRRRRRRRTWRWWCRSSSTSSRS